MKKFFLILITVFFPKFTLAHCPLCTVGAGALAIFAASIGISSVVIGVMIGGFAVALSTWLAKLPKKQYIPYQYVILATIIFLGTIIPIMPLVKDYGPFYVKIAGQYGSLLHNTYTINLFIVGSILGGIIMIIAPSISRYVIKLRKGNTIPYQGISISLSLLVVTSLVIEILS